MRKRFSRWSKKLARLGAATASDGRTAGRRFNGLPAVAPGHRSSLLGNPFWVHPGPAGHVQTYLRPTTHQLPLPLLPPGSKLNPTRHSPAMPARSLKSRPAPMPPIQFGKSPAPYRDSITRELFPSKDGNITVYIHGM